MTNAEKCRAYHAANKEKVSARKKRYYQENREKILEQKRASREEDAKTPQLSERKARVKRYGISVEQYDEMLQRQNGVCAICQKECQLGVSLGVDHDHKTGRVRGLLCRKCNTGIGLLGDDLESLQRAVRYLHA